MTLLALPHKSQLYKVKFNFRPQNFEIPAQLQQKQTDVRLMKPIEPKDQQKRFTEKVLN